MVVAYVDDSGFQEGSEAFILAGFAATSERWRHFDAAWAAHLSGPPRLLTRIKGTQAEGLRGEFSGWTPEERDAKLRALVEAIRGSAEFSLIATLGRRDWAEIVQPRGERVIEGDPIHNSVFSPYALLFSRCLLGVVAEAARRNEVADFVFDSQPEKERTARRVFGEGLPEHFDRLNGAAFKRHVGTLRFEREQSAPALQAADLLAWHVNRDLCSRTREGVRPLYTELLSLPALTVSVSRSDLLEIAASFDSGRNPYDEALREHGPAASLHLRPSQIQYRV